MLREHCERERRPYDAIEKTTLSTLWMTPEPHDERWLEPDQALERLAAFRDAGADHVIFNMPNVERPETLEYVAREMVEPAAKLLMISTEPAAGCRGIVSASLTTHRAVRVRLTREERDPGAAGGAGALAGRPRAGDEGLATDDQRDRDGAVHAVAAARARARALLWAAVQRRCSTMVRMSMPERARRAADLRQRKPICAARHMVGVRRGPAGSPNPRRALDRRRRLDGGSHRIFWRRF